MVALFDFYEDASSGQFETHVSISVPDVVALSDDVDIRLEKVSAACDAIARCHYDFDETVVDGTVDAVHHTLTMSA